MIIIVEYKSDVLGSGIFWKGKSSDIEQIKNIPARELAKKVITDGQQRSSGMWTVSVEKRI